MNPETFHWIVAFLAPIAGGAMLASVFFLTQSLRELRARKAKRVSHE